MSFSHKIKNEILSLPVNSINSAKAEIFGIFITGENTNNFESCIRCENDFVIKRMENIFLSYPELKKNIKIKNEYTSKFIYTTNISLTSEFILEFYSKYKKTLSKNNHDNEFLSSFLRGIFLSCGNINDPQSGYHLELNLPTETLSQEILNFLNSVKTCDFKAKFIKRRKNFIVYLKDSECIIDFLVFIGAKKYAMELMQIKMIKEVRNNVNRTTNFETANLNKITNSSSNQIQAIKKIKSTVGLTYLPDKLYTVAKIRLKHPYISLKEFSKLCGESISKSGINHRLKKIIKIAEDL
ncbi:MAG: DNA-binding protein WhiA [Clostridia bacterium]|nr:DNA-binding protein WhiA [Clostridia bacterium]